MMSKTYIRLLLILIAVMLAGHSAHAQTRPRTDSRMADSLHRESELNRRLYDSIRSKAQRRRIPKLLYGILFTDPAPRSNSAAAVDETELLQRYDGRRIGRISFERNEVFGHRHTLAARVGNRLHVLTTERAIRRDMLLHDGSTFDAATLVRNKQLLQSRPYISEAEIYVQPDPTDSATVDIVVRTRDRWSISVDGALNGGGRTMFSIYDANIFGTGNRLTLKTYFRRPSAAYGGNAIGYEIPNLLGTFFKADIWAGRSFTESELRLGMRHDFIAPTDFAAGVSFDRLHSDFALGVPDTTVSARLQQLHLWGGRTRYLPHIRSSVYLTGHYSRLRHGLRPDIAANLNPAFHDNDMLLFGLGLYRENFFTSNYIDGMGVNEYFATGYRAEVTGGYRFGEFGNDIYIGIGLNGGGFNPYGYFAGGMSVGSFINPHTGIWTQSGATADLRWFSNLHRAGHSLIRYYMSANYTIGWNRFGGYREYIGFTSTANVRNLKRSGLYGTNRLTVNTQAVFFTPLQPLGFRVAVVLFTDIGVLGPSYDILKNSWYNSLGVGLRIRNERLIFGTINLRVGFAWSRNGILPSRWFETSNNSPVRQTRYIPSRPETATFE